MKEEMGYKSRGGKEKGFGDTALRGGWEGGAMPVGGGGGGI